jgi:amidohydrolase
VYGLHCEPKLPTGTVGLRTGAITSATDLMVLELTGPGGHTARPERTVDLVHLVGRMVTELPDRLRARLGHDTPLKVVFGSVHAGAAPNVIPSHAELAAALRTTSEDAWAQLPDVVDEEVRAVVADDRAGVSITYTRGVPPVVNDAGAIAVAEEAVRRALGPEAAVPVEQSWGGDDFSWYTRRVPGAYLRLGTHDPSSGRPMLDLHAGGFDVDEGAIGIGVRVLTGIVEVELERRGSQLPMR